MSSLLGVIASDPASRLLACVVFAIWMLCWFRPTWALLGFLCYMPVEPAVVAQLAVGPVVMARYGAESVLYLLLFRSLVGPRQPGSIRIELAFAALVAACLVSVWLNHIAAFTAAAGIRQILRFTLLGVVSARLALTTRWVSTAFVLMLGLLFAESTLAIAQAVVGGSLVTRLMPLTDQVVEGIRVREAVSVTWDLHRRVPGTLGRYDRLGLLLATFLTVLIATRYLMPTLRTRGTAVLALLAIVALALTYSRMAWFAFALALAVLGWLRSDRRVLAIFAVLGVGVGALVVAASSSEIAASVDYPHQTLRQRVLEVFAVQRYEGEYDYLGRTYWVTKAPLVVASAPMFGVGPGMFGGGAAAALGNREVYERFGLPFGVWGSEGHIDNNWMSLAAEIGLLGTGAYLGLLLVPLLSARRLSRDGDAVSRTASLAYQALVPGVLLSGAMATALEMRAYTPYIWVLGGILVARDGAQKARTQ